MDPQPLALTQMHGFLFPTTPANPADERVFIATVADHLSNSQLTDLVGKVMIAEQENFLDESVIFNSLCEIQKNPPEPKILEEMLCKINSCCLPHFYKGKFRAIAEKLEAIAIPILESQLRENILNGARVFGLNKMIA